MSKTIREIPNCVAPTGCSSVVIVPEKERKASGEYTRKNRDFSSKGIEKQHFFTGSGKVAENLFHFQSKTILAWFSLDSFNYIALHMF